jgi:ATP-dependent protease HslVU (ClpYQ) ATPase subunit
MQKQYQNLKVRLTLNPGDRGTKKLVNEFGDKLICVRYRYDEKRGRRLKTVETIVEDIPWKAPPGNNNEVFVKAKWNEKDLHLLIKNAGGKYDKNLKLWKIAYGDAMTLGLKSRIVDKNGKSI